MTIIVRTTSLLSPSTSLFSKNQRDKFGEREAMRAEEIEREFWSTSKTKEKEFDCLSSSWDKT